jgi:hypothetical protein
MYNDNSDLDEIELLDREDGLAIQSVDRIEVIAPEASNQNCRISLLQIISYVISVIASMVGTTYAFLEPSNATIEEVSSQWWDNLSLATKVCSIIFAVSTFLVNSFFFVFFVENAFLKLKDSLAKDCNSCKDVSISTSNILLASSSALANATIAYRSYLWLPSGKLTAIFPSLLNFTVTFASRYVGLGMLTKRVTDLFNNDVKLQMKCIFYLQNLHAPFIDQINEQLANKPFNEETVQEVLAVLPSWVDATIKLDCFDYTKIRLEKLFDGAFALLLLCFCFMLFAQKGYDGVELTDDNALSDAHPGVKILVGFLPGIVSATFMSLNALDFREVMVNLVAHLRQHPKHIPLAILASVLCGIASLSGWRNVAIGTINSSNIFSLTSLNSGFAQAYIYINAISNFVTTLRPMSLKIIELTEPATKLDGFIDWLKKNRLSSETIGTIRRYSFFASPDSEPEQPSFLSPQV